MLERQYIEYVLTKGIDTSTDPQSQSMLVELDNAEPDLFGQFSTRNYVMNQSDSYAYLSCVDSDGVAAFTDFWLAWTKSLDSLNKNLLLIGRTGHLGACLSSDSDCIVAFNPNTKKGKYCSPISPYDMTFRSIDKSATYDEMSFDVLDAAGGPYYGSVTFDGTTARLNVIGPDGQKIKDNYALTVSGSGTLGACPKIIAIKQDTHGITNSYFLVVAVDTSTSNLMWNKYYPDQSVNGGSFKESANLFVCSTNTPNSATLAAIRVDHPTNYQCLLVATWDSANHVNVRGIVLSSTSEYSILATGMTGSATMYDIHMGHAGHDYDSGKRSVYLTWAYLTGGNYTIRGRLIEYGTSSISAPHSVDTIGATAVTGYGNCRVSSCMNAAYGTEVNTQWVMYSIGTTSYDTLAARSMSYLVFVSFAVSVDSILNQPGSAIGPLLRSKTTGKILCPFSICYTDAANTVTQPTYVVGELSTPIGLSSTYYWRPMAVAFPKQGSYSGAHKIVGNFMYNPSSSYSNQIIFCCVKQNLDAGYTNSYEYFFVTFDETIKGKAATCRDTIGSNRYYAGAVTGYYDGCNSMEANYIQHPIIEWQASTSEASGVAGSATYQYCAIYEVTNNNGEVERSGVSNIISVTLGADPFYHVDIRATCDVFGWYNKNRSGVSGMRIELYRTAGGSAGPFYRCQSSLHAYSPAITYIQIHDTMVDATLITNEMLYTTGNVLENTIPPPSAALAQHNQRIFIANQADRNEIWYSKTKEQGVAVEFAEEFTFRVQTDSGLPVTQLASMDGYLFIFTSEAIYRVHGDGPNSLGEGVPFPNPIKICSGVGAVDNSPILLTDMGILFIAKTGIHILGRDLKVQFIGEQVRSYRTRTFNAIAHMPSEKRVIFTMDAYGTTDPGALVWCYEKGQWVTFSGTWHSVFGVAEADDVIYVVHNNSDTSKNRIGSYTPTLSGTAITTDVNTMTIKTPWLRLGEFPRYQRVQMLHIVGSRSSGSYSVEIFCDGSSVVSETISGQTTFPFRWKPSKQKCSSMQVKITCAGDITISKIGLTVGLKKKSELGA